MESVPPGGFARNATRVGLCEPSAALWYNHSHTPTGSVTTPYLGSRSAVEARSCIQGCLNAAHVPNGAGLQQLMLQLTRGAAGGGSVASLRAAAGVHAWSVVGVVGAAPLAVVVVVVGVVALGGRLVAGIVKAVVTYGCGAVASAMTVAMPMTVALIMTVPMFSLCGLH